MTRALDDPLHMQVRRDCSFEAGAGTATDWRKFLRTGDALGHLALPNCEPSVCPQERGQPDGSAFRILPLEHIVNKVPAALLAHTPRDQRAAYVEGHAQNGGISGTYPFFWERTFSPISTSCAASRAGPYANASHRAIFSICVLPA